ncbi:MAG: polysaccharide biosynthesis protein [Chthoniobacterales bacterium]|nr:MAG: polysaccharide biosynthesis protein [Chthoniobacterales bacterium]
MSFFGPISPPLLDEASTPIVRRALHRARVVGSFAIVQAAVQIVGFLSGILLVRQLDQREYAYFTIANTMQGTLNVLADIGISIGLVSIGGRVWHDRHRFGQLVNTALGLRRKLGALAIVLVTPVVCFMLLKNGASVGYTAILIAILLFGLVVQLSLGVLGVVPRLRSDVGRIQTIDMTGAIARILALVALMYLFLNGAVALAIGSATLLLQYWMLRRYVAGVIDLKAPENAEDRDAMRGFIRSQAANAVFFCLQGQITVFLISFFGHVTSVAEVGALGRLAMIFAVLSHLLSNVFAPAFARCQSLGKLRWQYAAIVGAVAGFSLAVIGAAYLFAHEFLFVLGNKYAHLERELLLMVAGAVITAMAGTLWALNAAKAWIAGSWLYIPLTLATQLAIIPSTDFSSVRGVLMFNLISAIPSLVLNLILSFRGFRNWQLAAG